MPLVPLAWVPRILYQSAGTGLKRWNHCLTIIEGMPARIRSAVQGQANTGNGATVLLQCSAWAFIPWFSARLIILKEVSRYCNYPAPKTWVTSFRTLCFAIQAEPCSFNFCNEGFTGEKKKCLTRTSSEITNKAEHFSITEIGRRHNKVSKITHFWVWLVTRQVGGLTHLNPALQQVNVCELPFPLSFASSINWAVCGEKLW